MSGAARPRYAVIGHALPRPDAWEKVHGRPIYAGDFVVPGMLHGRIVRSPYASARIVAIDTAAAAAVPGAVAVLTHADVPRNAMRMALPGRMAEATAEARPAFQPVLGEDRVRFQGEPVVAIAAETPEAAALAAERVRVEYEELPGVYDPLEALAPGAPEVHAGGNLLHRWRLRRGDVDEGFRRADVTVEHTYHTPFIDHAYMETETGVGWIDAEGVVVLRVSTQVLEHFRDVADVLDLPHSRVRIEGAYLGGGFGGKEDVTVECLLGLLVWKTRRPVQLVFSREESFIGHGKRHPYVIRYRTGATRQGELTAIAAELTSDSGAYAALSPWVLLYSLVTATGPYRVPNVAVDARTVYTNNPIASAYRTFGSIQTCLAYEGQMDALAAALGMDPLELRERNFLRKGDSIGTGQVLESEPMLAETMRRAWAALGPRRLGLGPAPGGAGPGRLDHPVRPHVLDARLGERLGRDGAGRDGGGAVRRARRRRRADGVALLDRRRGARTGPRSGHRDRPGQPLHSARRDHHGHPPALHVGQRRAQGRSGGAGAPGGAGGRDAGGAPRRTSISPAGRRVVRGTTRGVPLADVVQTASAMGRPVQVLEKFDAPAAATIDPETGQGKAFNDFTFGTQAVEVEVDEETGRVHATRIAACYDVGQMINRHSAEGQVEGGVIQGLGHALMEEVVLEQGVSKNPHLFDYKIPSTLDAPPVEAILLESGQGLGPFGAKGIGEPAMTPTPGRRPQRGVGRHRPADHRVPGDRRARPGRLAPARVALDAGVRGALPGGGSRGDRLGVPGRPGAPRALPSRLPGARGRGSEDLSRDAVGQGRVPVDDPGHAHDARRDGSPAAPGGRRARRGSTAREPDRRALDPRARSRLGGGHDGRALPERGEGARAPRLGRRRGDEGQGGRACRRVRDAGPPRHRERGMTLAFTLNGRPCRAEAPDHWTVIDLLRDGLALYGTKYGCGEGVCGTCTVLLDGAPVRACLTLAARLDGRQLTTVEGLGDPRTGEPDALQDAFARLGAVQCGYCTPGVLLAARALLAENATPTEADVRRALAGNLCRCTGYVKIVEAVLAAARQKA